MAGERKWWQYNPEKVRANVEEARRFWGAARQGPRRRAMRPYHPDHDLAPDTSPGDDAGWAPPAAGSVEQRLAQLQSLLQQGLISGEDYEERKRDILREV